MTYTKQQIIEMCEKASEDMGSFYKAKFVNYKGMTKEKELYTEIIAEWLLNNLVKFNQIKTIERSTSYKTESHKKGEIGEKTSRVEEYVAKLLYNITTKLQGLGEIIDYQTPLKNPGGLNNDGLGKIDLLSKNDETQCVYILELKKADSEETMLRCVLEGYTYLRIVPKERLLIDFEIPASYELKASPLVYLNGYQYKEYTDKKRKNLHVLMEKLNSTPFFLKEITSFQITQE